MSIKNVETLMIKIIDCECGLSSEIKDSDLHQDSEGMFIICDRCGVVHPVE